MSRIRSKLSLRASASRGGTGLICVEELVMVGLRGAVVSCVSSFAEEFVIFRGEGVGVLSVEVGESPHSEIRPRRIGEKFRLCEINTRPAVELILDEVKMLVRDAFAGSLSPDVDISPKLTRADREMPPGDEKGLGNNLVERSFGSDGLNVLPVSFNGWKAEERDPNGERSETES